MSNNLEKLHTQPVWKAVLSNSVPAMIAMIMMLIYNIADMFFIGQTGDTLQVVAISYTSPMFLIFMAFGTIFGVGGATVCSRSFGAGDFDNVRKTSAFCIWGSIFTGIVVSIVVFFNIDIVIKILGAGEEVSQMVQNYIQIICLSGPFLMLSACMSNLVRAEGQAKMAMMGMMLGNLVNIVLNPIFILGFDLGVTGAAIATLIGNVIGGSFYIYYLLKRKSLLSKNIYDAKPEKDIVNGVLAIGLPVSLAPVFMCISQVLLNSEMTVHGDLAVAGIGIATKVSMMTNMLFMGLGQGVQPLLGYSIGAKDKVRYDAVLKFTLIFAFCSSSVVTLLCYLNLDHIVGAFLSNEQAFDYALSFSKVWLTTSALFGVFVVLMNALQAAGAAKASLLLNISRQGIIFIPALFILGGMFGAYGLVFAQPVADVLSLMLTIGLYIAVARKLFAK